MTAESSAARSAHRWWQVVMLQFESRRPDRGNTRAKERQTSAQREWETAASCVRACHRPAVLTSRLSSSTHENTETTKTKATLQEDDRWQDFPFLSIGLFTCRVWLICIFDKTVKETELEAPNANQEDLTSKNLAEKNLTPIKTFHLSESIRRLPTSRFNWTSLMW